MYKVIALDNLNRDYRPEQLITVSVPKDKAIIIADTLNQLNDSNYYMVIDEYQSLDLQSMYDITSEERPKDFIINQLGLNAIIKDINLDLDLELLKNKSKTELQYLKILIEKVLIS